jgi:hypothetical protein
LGKRKVRIPLSTTQQNVDRSNSDRLTEWQGMEEILRVGKIKPQCYRQKRKMRYQREKSQREAMVVIRIKQGFRSKEKWSLISGKIRYSTD